MHDKMYAILIIILIGVGIACIIPRKPPKN